ncbi:MAG: AzlC family ABC transporter permease [Hyphomicrobiaceae bacterium]|nr:AzlC family ABC transporter permease [Hyphomicrobiaceae bacterium]
MAAAHSSGLAALSAWDEFRQGTVAVVPAAVAVVPFGLLLGALAAQKGLSPLEVGLMSGLMFAGSAQMVAVDLWREPAPWALLGLAALTINLRHLMMGASLSRRLGPFGPWQRVFGMAFLVDEVWALAERRAALGLLHPAYYAGLAALLYANWVVWTITGAILGPAIENPAAWGFDFAFTAIFLGLIVAFWRGRGTALVMAASAAAAVAANAGLGGVWHVLAGGIAGMATAFLLAMWRGKTEP